MHDCSNVQPYAFRKTSDTAEIHFNKLVCKLSQGATNHFFHMIAELWTKVRESKKEQFSASFQCRKTRKMMISKEKFCSAQALRNLWLSW